MRLFLRLTCVFSSTSCPFFNLAMTWNKKKTVSNHLGEEADSKIKQCRTNSSLRSVLRPGKGGPFELSDKHGHLNVVKLLYRTILWVIILIYMKLYIWKVKSRKMVVFWCELCICIILREWYFGSRALVIQSW